MKLSVKLHYNVCFFKRLLYSKYMLINFVAKALIGRGNSMDLEDFETPSVTVQRVDSLELSYTDERPIECALGPYPSIPLWVS